MQAERHHWLNTILGLLDSTFSLTPMEEPPTIRAIQNLLSELNIPDRADAPSLPAAVALEVTSSHFTIQFSSPRRADLMRPPRRTSPSDIPVSLETWRQGFVSLITSAYDLSAMELLLTATVFNDILTELGVPNRAASYYPEEVLRAYQELPDSIH